ncbi:RimJ/RimL family protein N-acetyltransferase [Flavobacteriaceae bacterium MAR_2010_72]|nr:RimJ/RimL family protein N-acetyltransferase [Flavobacteriaceae bacterium MAR_2010_72]TVZ58158.1 RimJ/RimL family protein N-acetyltransferase [Flavobacteriaceae bacterium MAR_2010_105]
MEFHIETERIILRQILPTDIDGMFELDSDPDVHRYLGNKSFTTKKESEININDIIDQYAKFDIGRWAMIHKQTHEFMGWSGLKYYTKPMNGHVNFYDIGYRIIKRFWGHGYATESAKAALNYGFNTMNLKTIYGITHQGNIASHQVLLKIGLNYIEDFYDEDLKMKLRWYNILKS